MGRCPITTRRNARLACAAFCVAAGLVPSVADEPWPDPDWQVAPLPEQTGLSSQGMANLGDWLQQQAGSKPYGALVVRFGKIGFEQYGAGADAATKWEVGSIRKSIAGALLGIAVDDGLLTMDTVVHDVWPDIFTITGEEKDKQILMRELAVSTSGWQSPNLPGAVWEYSNRAFTAGHAVVGRVHDLEDDLIAPMVETRVKNVIGADDWTLYHVDPGWFSGSGPRLVVESHMRDLARYGYLWVRDGEWDGQQIFSAAYAQQATTNHVLAYDRHYGYWWFVNDGQVLLPDAPADTYFHIGWGNGNRRTVLLVCPSLSLVAAISSHKDAFDVGGDYLLQPVATVNDWIGRIVEAVVPVVGGNQQPVAHDSNELTLAGLEIDFRLPSDDPDGPGPYSYSAAQTTDGSLEGQAPDLLYTPDPGFVGTDEFDWTVHDGVYSSNTATLTLDVVDYDLLLLADRFDRPDSPQLDNDWLELEAFSVVKLENGAVWFDAEDEPQRPLMRCDFTPVTGGALALSFELGFQRTGNEGAYAFWMQLGDGALMSDADPTETGVAVNLKWGSPSQGLPDHEWLGAVADGAVQAIQPVSGPHRIDLTVDLDAGTYEVRIDGGAGQTFTFDQPVVAIDTVRFFTDGLNKTNFALRGIDDVLVYVPAGGPCGGGSPATQNLLLARDRDDILMTWDDPGSGGLTWNIYRDATPDTSHWGVPHAPGVTDEDPARSGIQITDSGAVLDGPLLYYLVTTVSACGESPLR